MKRRELFQLYEKLQGIKYLDGSNQFKVTCVKNMKAIEEEIRKSQEILAPFEGFIEFEKERIEVCERLAQKDENGDPLRVNEEYIIEDQEAFDKEVEKLKENHKEALIKRDDQILKYNKRLDENVSFDLLKVDAEDLPNEMTMTDIEDIYLMLK